MSRSFFDFFPAPKFLEMPAPGLSITDTGVRLIEFKRDHNNLSLKQYGEMSFPAGAIVSGAIVDSPTVIKILEEFRKKHGIQYIRTTLPEERAYLFRTKIENPSSGDLRTSVEFVIEENVPILVSDAVFDYTTLRTSKDENGAETLEVSVSVIPHDVVGEYLNLFRMAGFTPLHFEVESQAVTKAVVSNSVTRPVIVLNIGLERAGVYVVSHGAVAFSSIVPTSLPSTTSVSKSELKYILEDKDAKEANTAMIREYAGLEGVVEEVKKIVVYWQTQADKENRPVEQIETILICGEEGHRLGIPEYFSLKTGTQSELANVWTNAFSLHDYIPDIPLERSLGFAGAVGLALPSRDAN
jgi:type IV pilus assembly protein PilM